MYSSVFKVEDSHGFKVYRARFGKLEDAERFARAVESMSE